MSGVARVVCVGIALIGVLAAAHGAWAERGAPLEIRASEIAGAALWRLAWTAAAVGLVALFDRLLRGSSADRDAHDRRAGRDEHRAG